MKVCTVTHTVPSFGTIPVGSLWADDSPYVVDADCFADVEVDPLPVKPKTPVRKFGAKPAPKPAPETED